MSARLTVDLTLLKKMVMELEATLINAEKMHSRNSTDEHEYFAEMSKSAGLASGTMQEAAALVADIYQAMQHANKTAATDKTSLLGSILGKGGLGGLGGVN